MSKKIDDFTVASILYECMKSNSTRVVAEKYKLPYATIQQWEKKYTTIWVLNALSKGGVKIC